MPWLDLTSYDPLGGRARAIAIPNQVSMRVMGLGRRASSPAMKKLAMACWSRGVVVAFKISCRLRGPIDCVHRSIDRSIDRLGGV